MPARPAITGIAFVNFSVTDVAAADDFYARTLGLRRISSTDDPSIAPLTIYAVNPHQWISVAKPGPGKASHGSHLGAVGFRTANAAQLGAYLAAHGVAAERPVEDGELVVRDPEGNVICFIEDGAIPSVAGAVPSATATSHRIIHAGFVVKDRVAEDRFWRETLGFKPYWHGTGKDGTVGDDYVSLQVPDGTDWLEYMLHVSPTADAQTLGVMDHVSLGTAEMSTVVAQLKANGCVGDNCAKTQIGRDGKVQLNLFDPDLSRVEFMEFKPVRTPCCSPFTGPSPSAGDR